MKLASPPADTHSSQEFANLTPNNTIFKLVGPVLVLQDHTEARTNVETRLDFIRGEMCVCRTPLSHLSNWRCRKRIDNQIKDTEEQSEKKKLEVCRPVS